MLTHIPSRNWCSVCVRSKAHDDPHFRQGHERFGDEVQVDYYFMDHLSIFNMVHMSSGAIHAILGPQGLNAYMIKTAVAAIDGWGLDKITLKQDQEPAVANRRESIVVEAAQRANCQGVGGVERTSSELGKEIRALKLAAESAYKRILPDNHPLYPWMHHGS